MRYLLLMYRDEQAWEQLPEQERGAVRAAAYRYHDELGRLGQVEGGAPLHPTRTATTVRLTAGRAAAMDGPFAETREVLGGYTVLIADSREAAIEIASRHPLVQVGRHAIEIRPIREREPTE